MADANVPIGVFRGVLPSPRSVRVEITPVTAAASYLVFGSILLFASDFLLPRYVSGGFLAQIQTLKGFFEVVVTSGFIFLITKGSRRQLKDANNRLKRRQEELDVLHRVLRHNLRNKMNVVTASTSLIRERVADSRHAVYVRERCAAIDRSAEAMLDRSETAQLIRRVSESDDTIRLDATTVFEGAVAPLAGSDTDICVTTATPERALVEAHPLLSEAAGELVDNAVRHNDAPNPELSVSVETDDADAVVVEVVDNGPGIPDAVANVVLSGEQDQIKHLNGLGLWFVYWCVDASGGEMDIENEDRGSCVRLRLPRAR